MTATNLGPDGATGVFIFDRAPTPNGTGGPYAPFVGTPSAGGSYDGVGWSIPRLAAGASATLTLTGFIGAIETSITTNTAERFFSSPTDPNPANDPTFAVID